MIIISQTDLGNYLPNLLGSIGLQINTNGTQSSQIWKIETIEVDDPKCNSELTHCIYKNP